MALQSQNTPVVNPTPYPTNGLGANQYVTPGTVGVSIPMQSVPMQSIPGGSVGWSTGQVTPASTVNTVNNAAAPVTNTPTPQPVPTPTGDPNAGKNNDQAAIDAIFSPVFDALNGQANTLQSNYATTQSDINQQADTAQNSLATQNTSGMNQLDQLGTEAGGTKADALTSATRLYNELTRGGQQRFGGASSAGEAFQALTAVEQQRRQATIQTAYDTAMQKIAGYKSDLTSKYQDSVAQLQSQKLSALNTASQQFNDAMQQIQTSKSQASSDKAQATLQNLQDYRNKVYTINLQAVQFAQTLAANNQASLSAVDTYTNQVLNNLNSGNQTYQNLGSLTSQAANSSTYSNVGANQSVVPTVTQTGAISSTAQKPDYSKYPLNGYTA